jgi:TRAP-type C4-dicarboxylate transport system substrate-binding protein
MKIVRTAVIAASLLLAAVSAQAQAIKFGTLAPEGSPWYQIARDMAAEWKKASGGKIDVRIYPGGVVGDDPDMVRKIRIGQLQMAGLTGEGLRQIVPEINALQMPMLLTTDDELNYVRAKVSPELESLLEAKGFKLLAWADVGWVQFFTSHPVIRPDDLKSEKLWTWTGEDTTYLEAWKAAGYQPVPLPATEIYTGLQSRLITAVMTTPLASLSFQWYGKANHLSDLNWAPFVGAVVISLKAWNEIPDAMKPALLATAKTAGGKIQALVVKLNADAISAMQKRGLTIEHVSPDVAAEWESRTRALAYPKLVGTAVPAPMLAKVQTLRDEYRKDHPAK